MNDLLTYEWTQLSKCLCKLEFGFCYENSNDLVDEFDERSYFTIKEKLASHITIFGFFQHFFYVNTVET